VKLVESIYGRSVIVKSSQYFTPFASKNRLVISRKASYLLPDFHSSRSIKDGSGAGNSANGEEQSVKSLLGSEPMQSLEKSSLIDLAKLSGNRQILALLKDIPEKE
jgi:hypothetical protein